MLQNRIIYAPVQQPAHVLDVSCEEGTVTCGFSRLFPSAKVCSVDIDSPKTPIRKPVDVQLICRNPYNLVDPIDAKSQELVLGQLQ